MILANEVSTPGRSAHESVLGGRWLTHIYRSRLFYVHKRDQEKYMTIFGQRFCV